MLAPNANIEYGIFRWINYRCTINNGSFFHRYCYPPFTYIIEPGLITFSQHVGCKSHHENQDDENNQRENPNRIHSLTFQFKIN